MTDTIWLLWRHPRPQGIDGRCIGRTDVRVDPRKGKRLAHRIRRCRRLEGGPLVVVTSPLQRCASVGRWLKAWGWTHLIDERLSEMDFGRWDGHRWHDIGAAAVDAWCADFMHHHAGGGESVAQLLARCENFLAQWQVDRPPLIVGHAGWASAAAWLARRQRLSDATGTAPGPSAADWPTAVGYGERVTLTLPRLVG
jgi:alpha-ribazole phosphatase